MLLDFGLTKDIDDEIRYNFAKLLVAVAEQDIHGLISALDGVGLKLRIDVPFDVSLLAKYFFRDASKQKEAQKESVKRREEWKKKAEEKKKSMYVGDKVDVTTTTMFCMRNTRKGEVVGIRNPASHHRQGKSGPLVTVRLTDGSEVEVDRDSVAVQRSRSPIDAWPDSFIFFDRVLGTTDNYPPHHSLEYEHPSNINLFTNANFNHPTLPYYDHYSLCVARCRQACCEA